MKPFTIPPLRVLAAVSGGMDSMCLAALLLRSGVVFGIAHCNFSLRGEESDADEALVRDWASANGIPFHCVRFDTETYARERGISIEMAARELRYRFFAETARAEGYGAVAVAHNANDNAETLILNMLRGSGSRGMSGMKASSPLPIEGYGDIPLLRPLLGDSREEIEEFVLKEGIPYREDRTNSENEYRRNRIRNLVFPVFREINPSFLTALEADASHIAEVDAIAEEYYRAKRAEVTDGERIDIAALMALPHWRYILFRLMEERGFSPSRTEDLSEALLSEGQKGGKEFHSRDWVATTTSSSIVFSPAAFEDPGQMAIDGPGKYTFNGREILVEVFDRPSGMALRQPQGVIVMDADICPFPFTLRGWKDGDRFVPLGMKGCKKLQDFFSDRKYSLPEKRAAVILARGEKVLAVLGERPDNCAKVTDLTRKILRISL